MNAFSLHKIFSQLPIRFRVIEMVIILIIFEQSVFIDDFVVAFLG